MEGCLPCFKSPAQRDKRRREATGLVTIPGRGREAAPRWLEDCEQDCCYSCGEGFSLLLRRHHCRRCANLFCDRCSSVSAPLLALGMTSPSRVCQSCGVAALEENSFFDGHLPLLRRGAHMQRAGTLPGTKHAVVIGLSADGASLELRRKGGRGAPSVTVIPLQLLWEVEQQARDCHLRLSWHAPPPSPENAPEEEHEVHGPALAPRTLQGTARLEASSKSEALSWINALRAAVERSTGPSLREQVEEERKGRKTEQWIYAQKVLAADARRARQQTRAQLAKKYNLDVSKYT